MDINELIVVIGIAVVSFNTGYLLCEMHSFRRYIKENCLK